MKHIFHSELLNYFRPGVKERRKMKTTFSRRFCQAELPPE
jgi:hypothetical protein